MTEKNIIWKEINGVKWCYDENDNCCSVKYWGSEEKALEALRSLKNCSRCSDCSGCSDCSRCSYCSGCSRCSNCSNCSGCSGQQNKENPKFAIPKIENIHQKVLEAATAKEGALNMETWHTCATTHCRAGWVIFLAGKEGADLEKKFDPAFAASLIYRESSSIKVGMNEFFKNNEEALESMRAAAEAEKLLINN